MRTRGDGDRRTPRGRRGVGSALLAMLGIMMIGVVGCSASGGAVAPGAGGEAAVDEQGADGDAADDRSVVIEGTMRIVVADAPKAASDVTAAVAAAGGRIDGREEWDAGESADASATLVLRIPAEALDATLDALRELGEVESLQTSATDVTTAARDLEARISGLASTIARLTSFQGAASSVDDLLEIEKEITTRQTELEDLRAQQTALSERVAFSTITVTLRETAASVAAPDTFWGGLVLGWNALVAFFGAFFVVLGVALPWLLLAAIVALVVILLVRRARRRAAPRGPVAPQGPVPPAP